MKSPHRPPLELGLEQDRRPVIATNHRARLARRPFTLVLRTSHRLDVSFGATVSSHWTDLARNGAPTSGFDGLFGVGRGLAFGTFGGATLFLSGIQDATAGVNDQLCSSADDTGRDRIEREGTGWICRRDVTAFFVDGEPGSARTRVELAGHVLPSFHVMAMSLDWSNVRGGAAPTGEVVENARDWLDVDWN